jgi:hypothetical protein
MGRFLIDKPGVGIYCLDLRTVVIPIVANTNPITVKAGALKPRLKIYPTALTASIANPTLAITYPEIIFLLFFCVMGYV